MAVVLLLDRGRVIVGAGAIVTAAALVLLDVSAVGGVKEIAPSGRPHPLVRMTPSDAESASVILGRVPSGDVITIIRASKLQGIRPNAAGHDQIGDLPSSISSVWI